MGRTLKFRNSKSRPGRRRASRSTTQLCNKIESLARVRPSALKVIGQIADTFLSPVTADQRKGRRG